jgi:hypothetical protein
MNCLILWKHISKNFLPFLGIRGSIRVMHARVKATPYRDHILGLSDKN